MRRRAAEVLIPSADVAVIGVVELPEPARRRGVIARDVGPRHWHDARRRSLIEVVLTEAIVRKTIV